MVISEAKNELTTKTKPKQQDADRKCEQGTVQKLRVEGAQKRATFKKVIEFLNLLKNLDNIAALEFCCGQSVIK